ncbi:Substrate-specific component PdxU of putative pyridoxine ECF transporter [Streptococcus sp. DD10]|uniref:ECF transporter S component n=1 Tax=Streptococcus sp. DD10 TaxID=1777878 RepID=UPI000798E3E4|nr:ECF transporter S component [Streptococcus sp. DD10]KXT74575.1 Substrate-specific component PdxU of putative pyridoxine ECF transporter [Streptococcus sp. DD10]
MKKTNLTLRELTLLSLYAALIYLSIQFFRIPVGPQFIHFGNALVLVGFLLFGSKKGFLAAAVGLSVFDILNGYTAVVWITVLESGVVALIVFLLFEKILKGRDRAVNIVGVAVAGAVTKILLNLVKYTITGMLGGSLSWDASVLLAFGKIVGSFGSALATVVAVPILYPVFKGLLTDLKNK